MGLQAEEEETRKRIQKKASVMAVGSLLLSPRC